MHKAKKCILVFIVVFTVILAILVISLYIFPWLTNYEYTYFFGDSIKWIKTDKKMLALTYDDGPNPPYTEKLLDLLQKHKAKATFFVLGKYAQRYPEIIRRMIEEGHEIGNHSWTHKFLTEEKPWVVRKEIVDTDKLIRRLGYNKDIFFRAPFAQKNLKMRWILFTLRKRHVLFNSIAYDWEDIPVATMMDNIETRTRPGSILLLHDGSNDENKNRQKTIEVTEKILNRFKEKGYSFVTVSRLIADR